MSDIMTIAVPVISVDEWHDAFRTDSALVAKRREERETQSEKKKKKAEIDTSHVTSPLGIARQRWKRRKRSQRARADLLRVRARAKERR